MKYLQKNLKVDSTISGYASKFNIIDRQNDIIEPQAFIFDNYKNIKLLWQHDHSKPIGSIQSIEQNNTGLFIIAKIIANTYFGNEAISLIKEGAINGLSVGFEVIEQNFDSYGKRHILKAKLFEISIVTFPANEETNILEIKHFDHNYYKNNHYYKSFTRLESLINQLSDKLK